MHINIRGLGGRRWYTRTVTLSPATSPQQPLDSFCPNSLLEEPKPTAFEGIENVGSEPPEFLGLRFGSLPGS